jgi:hypothetical protein
MPTTIDWPTFQGYFAGAVDALESGDLLGARRKIIQAWMIARGLGAAVSASGTTVDLLVEDCQKINGLITEYGTEKAKLSGNGRLIKTGLRNSGRGWAPGCGEVGGGVLHD